MHYVQMIFKVIKIAFYHVVCAYTVLRAEKKSSCPILTNYKMLKNLNLTNYLLDFRATRLSLSILILFGYLPRKTTTHIGNRRTIYAKQVAYPNITQATAQLTLPRYFP
jgi:hypothetical protein